MNRLSWIIAGIVLALALGGALLFIHGQEATAPARTQPQSTGNAAVGADGTSYVVAYTDTGFSPTPVMVRPGTTVTWTNQSSRPMWVQTTGPGGSDCSAANASQSFNTCKAVGNGGSYSFTFAHIDTFPYFNHERSQDTGIVIVSTEASAGPLNPNAQPQ